MSKIIIFINSLYFASAILAMDPPPSYFFDPEYLCGESSQERIEMEDSQKKKQLEDLKKLISISMPNNAEIIFNRVNEIEKHGDVFMVIPEIACSGIRRFLLEVWGPTATNTLNALASTIVNLGPKITLNELQLNGLRPDRGDAADYIKAVQNFFKALQNDSHIEILNFSINHLDDNDAIAFASALELNKKLTHVSMVGNFSEFTLMVIGAALSKNSRLQKIEVYGPLKMAAGFAKFETAAKFFTIPQYLIVAKGSEDRKTIMRGFEVPEQKKISSKKVKK